jgi:hypothetical protein
VKEPTSGSVGKPSTQSIVKQIISAGTDESQWRLFFDE